MLTKIISQIAVASITFIVLDALWLGLVAKQFYISNMGSFLNIENGSIKANWLPTVLVYIVLIMGVVMFAVPKANGALSLALLYGAILGLITYGTYDFTNHAVMKDWPAIVTIVDVLWGMTITSITTFMTVLMVK